MPCAAALQRLRLSRGNRVGDARASTGHLALYHQPVAWRRMQTTAMTQDFGWDASARHYLAVYRKLAPHARPSAISEEQMRELPVV
jgi:glycogen synthase